MINTHKNFQYYPANIKRAVEVHHMADVKLILIDQTETQYYKALWPAESYSTSFLPEMQEATQLSPQKVIWQELELIRKSESIQEVKKRIDNAMPLITNFSGPTYAKLLDEAGTKILKKSFDLYQFSFQGLNNAFKLTDAIRALDHTKSPKASHIAEAIQYVSGLHAHLLELD